MPPPNPRIRQFSTRRAAPRLKVMPIPPDPAPSIDRPRRVATTPFVLTRTPVAPLGAKIPAVVPVQSIVIDLLMLRFPKSPASTQLISPPASVTPIANAKVRHGAARVHVPESLPVPDTNVRGAD